MEVPYLTHEELEAHAEAFLKQYMVERVIPVPIEEIVEADLGIDVLPIPGFRDRFGIDGYISNDLTTLVVDEGTMLRNPNRYRFTIAHEISHYILHGQYIQQEFPENAHDWKQRLLKRNATVYTRLENQANRMAGALLVPRQELMTAWDDVKRYAQQRGIDVDELDEFGISHLAARVARDFKVSGKTLEIALERYKLINKDSIR